MPIYEFFTGQILNNQGNSITKLTTIKSVEFQNVKLFKTFFEQKACDSFRIFLTILLEN